VIDSDGRFRHGKGGRTGVFSGKKPNFVSGFGARRAIHRMQLPVITRLHGSILFGLGREILHDQVRQLSRIAGRIFPSQRKPFFCRAASFFGEATEPTDPQLTPSPP
jgi:hypothetical protein